MKVLILNPPMKNGLIYMKELGRCGRKSVAGEVWPQTGLAYVAAVLRERGHEILFLDAMAIGLDINQTLQRIIEFNPLVALIHATTPTFKSDAEFLDLIKKKTTAVCGLVGTHPTALPEECLKQSNADFAIVSEAEITASDFCDKFNSDWSQIPGIAYRKEGEIIKTLPRPLLNDLDSLPFPARDLTPVEKYTMPFFGSEPFVTVIPSRGCPFQCTFCRAGMVWGENARHRNPDNVCDELEEIIHKYHIHNVVMMTDTLTIKVEWTKTLCQRIIDRGIKIRWIGNSRVDTVTPELLQLMQKSGCEVLSFGLESGNQEILNQSKKHIDLEQAVKAIRWAKEAGITTFGYFIVGLPGESWDTIKESIQFAIRANPDYVNFHVATPFPGTELYEIAKKNNWLITDDWSQYEEEGSAVMRTENLTPEDLVKAQKMAMRAFYLRPSRIFREMLQLFTHPHLIHSKVKAAIKVLSEI
jgi:radical SAM superfamily enzyme YgiQ (UPF0313 family)